MSFQSTVAVVLVSLALAPAAFAQTSGTTTTESTSVATQTRSGEVQGVFGNRVLLKEADGLHEYTVPDGFKFQTAGGNVGVDQITPGMQVSALITDKTTTRNVTLTRIASGTVTELAPGGIVLKDDATKDFKSYNFKDAAGNDIYYLKDGKAVSLRDVKKGEHLAGTFVTTLPQTQSSQRTVVAKAVAPEPPTPAATVAAATPRHLPKTASPLPLIGLIAALSAAVALTLRAARAAR
jgi:hypothetical protein